MEATAASAKRPGWPGVAGGVLAAGDAPDGEEVVR